MIVKNLLLTAALTLAVATPGFGDVTVKMTTSNTGGGVANKVPGTVYVKGQRMRTDLEVGNRIQTTIFDVDAQRMYVFDSTRKEADAWDMRALAAELSQTVAPSAIAASIHPTGQTKEIGGQSTTGYQLAISVAADPDGKTPMQITAKLAGPVWIASGAPGAAEYTAFYRAAVEKGFIFSDPRVARTQPGAARAMAVMYQRMADIGGIPYASDVQISLEGSGPLAAAIAKIGNITMSTAVDSVATGTVPDDLFAPPAGYTITARN
jgi:hypothetical protein